MTGYLKKLLAALGVVVVVMIEGSFLIATLIGLTTAQEDAAKLPSWFQWLIGAPWWVPAIVLPALLVAFAAWVFRPDLALARQSEASLKEYRAANDRAWSFSGEMSAFKEALTSRQVAIESAMDETNQHL